MNLDDLTALLQGTLATNGWDAVCAVNVANLNQLFADWYLTNGPTDPNLPIQFAFQNDTNFYLFDAVLGPPEISFEPGGGDNACQISMIVVSGTLVEFDPAQSTIISAYDLLPDFANVVGAVNLAKVQGDTVFGKVTLSLGAGSYSPVVSGIPPTSTQAAALGTALQNYFQVNPTNFDIGSVTTAEISDYLQPTSFEFVVQNNPDVSGDGCVLLLIETVQGMGGGPIAPLTVYPIPDSYTASLIVSNNSLFNGLFPEQLTNAETSITFSAFQPNSGPPYAVAVTSGSADLGVISYPGAPGQCYTSNGEFEHWWSTGHESADVVISFVGLTLSSVTGQLSASYSSEWTQGWAYMNQSGLGPTFPGDAYETADTTLTYKTTAPVTIVQPSSCVVTFPWTGTPTCISILNENLLGGFGQIDPGSLIVNDLETQLAPVFSSIDTITGLDTFALQNILFYPNQSLSLADGTLPTDLLLVGQTVPQLVISPGSPVRVGIPSGNGAAFVDFSASYQGQPATGVIWEMIPSSSSHGSIDSNTGVYTAPASVPVGAAVKIMATSGQQSGHALVILYPALASTGLTVSPPSLILTEGQSVDLTVTDDDGNSPTVTWTLDPASPEGGAIANVFGTWQYTAPAAVSASTTVTLTATDIDDTSQTGTSVLNLLPTATLEVTPSATSVATSGQLTLAANVPDGLTAISWMVYPTGAGIVSADGLGSATFTAGSSPVSSVQIVAYGLGDVAAVGYCSVAITT